MSPLNETGYLEAGSATEQVDKLAAETAEMKAVWKRTLEAYRKRNILRTCITLGVLAIIVVYCFMFYSLVKNFDDKKLMALIEQKSQKWMPYLSGFLSDELTRTGQAYMKELDRQAPKIVEELNGKLASETDKLMNNVTKIPETALTEQTNRVLDSQKALITQKYPELGPQGADGVISNLREGMSKVALQTISTRLEPQRKTLEEIKEILKSMKSAPISKNVVQPPPDVDELLYTALELLKYHLARETLQPKEAKPARKGR